MITVLEIKDIRYLQKMGYYFFENTPYRSSWNNNGKNSNENPIIYPRFYDSEKGIITLSNRTIRTSNSNYHILDNMKLGHVKCFNISSPITNFVDGELKIEFKEFTYDEVVQILQREYNLNSVLDEN